MSINYHSDVVQEIHKVLRFSQDVKDVLTNLQNEKQAGMACDRRVFVLMTLCFGSLC